MLRTFIAVIFTVTAFITTPISVAKAKSAQKETKELQSIFTDLLEQQKAGMAQRGAEMKFDGDIMVEDAETYYAVTLPPITITYPDNTYVNIGMIAINAIAGNEPKQWQMTAAIPSPITLYEENSTPIMVIEFGRQHFAGIWHTDIRNFIKLNARYEDIKAFDPSDSFSVHIPVITSSLNLTEDAEHLWSGPARFIVEGTSIILPEDSGKITIGKINMEMEIIGYAVNEALAYQEKMAALSESYEAGDKPSLSGQHVLGIYNLVSSFLGEIWDGFTVRFDIEDWEITNTMSPELLAAKLKIDQAGFGFGMTGFRSDKVKFNITTGYSGLHAAKTRQGADQDEIMPTSANVDISVNNLPYHDFVNLGRDSLKIISSNPAMAKLAGLQAITAAPALLTQAGTNLSLQNTFLRNDTYNVLVNGVLAANAHAVRGAQGHARVEIVGIDRVIEYFNKQIKDPEMSEERNKQIQTYLTGINMVKLLGQQEQNKDGVDIRSYNLELKEDGQTLLNGADIGPLIQPPEKNKATPTDKTK